MSSMNHFTATQQEHCGFELKCCRSQFLGYYVSDIILKSKKLIYTKKTIQFNEIIIGCIIISNIFIIIAIIFCYIIIVIAINTITYIIFTIILTILLLIFYLTSLFSIIIYLFFCFVSICLFYILSCSLHIFNRTIS